MKFWWFFQVYKFHHSGCITRFSVTVTQSWNYQLTEREGLLCVSASQDTVDTQLASWLLSPCQGSTSWLGGCKAEQNHSSSLGNQRENKKRPGSYSPHKRCVPNDLKTFCFGPHLKSLHCLQMVPRWDQVFNAETFREIPSPSSGTGMSIILI